MSDEQRLDLYISLYHGYYLMLRAKAVDKNSWKQFTVADIHTILDYIFFRIDFYMIEHIEAIDKLKKELNLFTRYE